MFARRRSQSYEYTPEVKRVLAAAGKEAIRLKHGAVGTEHLLLGALAEPGCMEVIRAWGSSPDQVRHALDASVVPGQSESDAGRPLAPEAKSALVKAMASARSAGGPVTLASLLSAVASEGMAATIVRKLGGVPGDAGDATARTPVGAREPLVELDDGSDLPIAEQIVAQITEGIAVGRLAPGERLPAVRHLADTLRIAPGTVARAYSELERRKIVTTDGARGTRVSLDLGSSEKDGSCIDNLSREFRPIVVAAFHSGAGSAEVRAALERAMRDIFD